MSSDWVWMESFTNEMPPQRGTCAQHAHPQAQAQATSDREDPEPGHQWKYQQQYVPVVAGGLQISTFQSVGALMGQNKTQVSRIVPRKKKVATAGLEWDLTQQPWQ